MVKGDSVTSQTFGYSSNKKTDLKRLIDDELREVSLITSSGISANLNVRSGQSSLDLGSVKDNLYSKFKRYLENDKAPGNENRQP